MQLDVRDPVASVTRPVRQLKAFRKIRLAQGQSRHVAFTLREADLAFWRRDMTRGTEPGDIRRYIGTSSEDAAAVDFTLGPAQAAAGGEDR